MLQTNSPMRSWLATTTIAKTEPKNHKPLHISSNARAILLSINSVDEAFGDQIGRLYIGKTGKRIDRSYRNRILRRLRAAKLITVTKTKGNVKFFKLTPSAKLALSV